MKNEIKHENSKVYEIAPENFNSRLNSMQDKLLVRSARSHAVYFEFDYDKALAGNSSEK